MIGSIFLVYCEITDLRKILQCQLFKVDDLQSKRRPPIKKFLKLFFTLESTIAFMISNCFIFGNSLPPRLYTLTSSLRECNLRLFKWGYLHHCGPGKGLKGIFGNRTCLFINWWSLEIMLTDPNMYSNLMHLLDNRKIRKRRLSRIKFIDFFIDWIYR